MKNCLRQIDFSSVILQFAWGFLLSTVESLIFLTQLNVDRVILLSAWGFLRITNWRDTFLEAMVRRRADSSVRLRLFLVSRIEGIHFLKRWSVDELIFLSVWGFFSYHILKGYVSWSDGASTSWFLRPPKAFFILRIEGIRIWRGMGVRGRRCAVTWDWRQQNKKRSRMRLSSGSLRFLRRHRGALCAV